MLFEEYLKEKNIDPIRFKEEETSLYRRFESEFSQISANSFTAQKKFFINDLRRRFLLKDYNLQETAEKNETKVMAKPVFKRPS